MQVIKKHVPNPEAALLLWFKNNSSGRGLFSRRLGYAFCPYCISHQSFVHVPWEWAFACLLHCSVHGSPLGVGCPSCGHLDPLPFGLTPVAGHVPCHSCNTNLSDDPPPNGRGSFSRTVLEFERGYRAALLSIHRHVFLAACFKEYEQEQERRAEESRLEDERREKEWEAERARREKMQKARNAKFDRILENAPAMFTAAQLRVFLRALVNLDPTPLPTM